MDESTHSPPVIDATPLLADPESPASQACATRIHEACLEWGFFVLVGHGLEPQLDQLLASARSFFAQPQHVKEQTPRSGGYGFVPLSSLAIDTSRSSDATEYLDLGLTDEAPLPALPDFEQVVRGYQRAALDIAAAILRAVALGSGADPGFFAERMADPQCKLRFLHYPAVDPDEDGVLPVPTAAHTDYGALTLLATDGVAGLEVRPLDRPWVPVVAPRGSLVVNLGDMLARWTNDRYQSTPHRVVGPTSGDRVSIPFFVNPDPDTVVTPISACVDDQHPAAYGPITAGAFLRQRREGSDEPYVDPGAGPDRRPTAG